MGLLNGQQGLGSFPSNDGNVDGRNSNHFPYIFKLYIWNIYINFPSNYHKANLVSTSWISDIISRCTWLLPTAWPLPSSHWARWPHLPPTRGLSSRILWNMELFTKHSYCLRIAQSQQRSNDKIERWVVSPCSSPPRFSLVHVFVH